MKRLARLEKEALGGAQWRGHRMSPWRRASGTSESNCLDCGRWVFVQESPPPNGIDIGGEAVALGCNRMRT